MSNLDCFCVCVCGGGGSNLNKMVTIKINVPIFNKKSAFVSKKVVMNLKVYKNTNQRLVKYMFYFIKEARKSVVTVF